MDNTLDVSKRIKMARLQLGLTRKQFSSCSNIPPPTLQAWETGRYSMTEKGLSRYIRALKLAGLNCSPSWLLYGKLPAPYLLQNQPNENNNETTLTKQMNAQENVFKEIHFFETLYDNSIVMLVQDETMQPFFNVGDYVGGLKTKQLPANYTSNTPCIVKLINNDILIRYVQYTNKKNSYNLFISNIHFPIIAPVLYAQTVEYFAAVTWHRRYPFY